MSTVFDLEGTSFLPASSDADVAAATDPASGQKRLRPEEGDTASGQKRLRRSSFASTTQLVRRGEKQARTDNPEDVGRGEKRARTDNPEDHEDDTRSEGGETTKTNTSADSGCDLLPISLVHGRVPVCAYCNKKADSKSPLLGSSPDDPYGGLLPWNGYTKYFQGHGDDPTPFKKPSGERCSICSQSYFVSGMSSQHGKLEAYKKNVIEKTTDENQTTHKTFLQMRGVWIKQYNDQQKANQAPTASGKKKTALSVAGQSKVKSRYVEVRKEVKTAVAGRDRDFIEKEHWDPKLDGVYDLSKELTILTHGKMRKRYLEVDGQEGSLERNYRGIDNYQ